jgi:hypothetical protein
MISAGIPQTLTGVPVDPGCGGGSPFGEEIVMENDSKVP